MFEVGFTEILLILGVALLVLGPEKLPGLAEKVGRWTGRARSMARQLRTQLEQEVTIEEMAKARPMQAGPAAAAAAATSAPEASSAYSQYPPAEAFASSPPPPPDFDLDAMVSGIEPPADAVMKAAQPAGEIAAEVTAPAPIEPGANSRSG
jgi:Tat protein translocase TatB subunit